MDRCLTEGWGRSGPAGIFGAEVEGFWDRANSLVGYDHTELLGPREVSRIGDGMTVRGWIDLLERCDFQTVDTLWRDADVVIVAARKA